MSRREQNPNKSDETEELANEFDEKAALNESNARDNGANEEEVLDEKAAMRQGDEIDALLTDTPPASRPESRGAGEGEQTRKEELQHIFDQFDGNQPKDSKQSNKDDETTKSSSSNDDNNDDNSNSNHNSSINKTTNQGSDNQSKPSAAVVSSTASNNINARRASLAEIRRTADERKGREREEIPFDFHKFLEQMHRRSATPIVKYFKSFLHAFDRRPYAVHEQVKIIQDFLEFIYVKMRECEVWRNASEQEFENAKEGMEKLVMNRLYNVTFSPSTTDDKERDEILHQKISIFRWIREEHLDIPKNSENESFFKFAISELLKINNYKAPRDKLICILNCCKVIFGLIKHVEGDGGADKFLPILIYVVIKANPPRLISNVQYISRFRSPEHLQSESGYYLTNLMGSISFIETMDACSLSITKEEFDANIERTMNELEKERPSVAQDKQKINYDNAIHPYRSPSVQPQPLIDPVKAAALIEKGSTFAQKTMQKPLNFVGKIFQGLNEGSPGSSDDEGSSQQQQQQQQQRSYPHDDPRYQQQQQQQYYYAAPAVPGGIGEQPRSQRPFSPHPPPHPTVPDPRAVEAQRVFEANLQSIVSMFSNVDPEVCFMVFQAKGGDVSQTVDALLEIADPEATPTGATETTGEETVATPPRPPPKTPASGNNETDGREEELIRL